MGLNSDAHLEREARGARTFAEEATWWRTNKLSLFKPSCQEAMGSHSDKYLIPRFGALPPAAIENKQTQELIAHLSHVEYKWPNGVSRKVSSKSIRNVVEVLKQILGKKVWRDWPDLKFPEDPVREQRWFSQVEMLQIVNAATGQWRVLFALLGGSGLRAGEAFGLHVEDLDPCSRPDLCPAQRLEREGGHRQNEERVSHGQRRPGARFDVDGPPRRAHDRPGIRDADRHDVLQVEREAQAEPDPQEAQTRTWRAPCVPPRPRICASPERCPG